MVHKQNIKFGIVEKGENIVKKYLFVEHEWLITSVAGSSCVNYMDEFIVLCSWQMGGVGSRFQCVK